MPPLEDLVLQGLKGRNGGDPPFQVLESQSAEALNVELYRSSFGRKRRGSEAVSMTGQTQTDDLNFIGRFEVDEDSGNNELWVVDDAATPVVSRLAGGTTWASVTLTDNLTAGDERKVDAVSFNGKYFLAYNSTANRLHVYDPADGKARRVGLSTPSGFTSGDLADTGSGSYAATIRYYKQAYLVKSGDDILRRSELTDSVSFTPSGTGTGVVITKADTSSPAEDETHWEVYGSADDAVFYLLATTEVATTTYTDSTNPEDYSGDLAPSIGQNVPPPSPRYLIADDARIVMAGAWESAAGGATAPKNNRVWWTPVLGTTNIGDDERVPNISGEVANYVDMESPIVGLGGPILGSLYVFARDRFWKMTQTGNVRAPYIRIPMSSSVGCLRHRSIVLAEDEDGNPALYWLSREGPKRIGVKGLADMTQDVQDIWESVNLETDEANFGVWYPERHQIWWWVDTTGNNASDTVLIYHTHEGRQGDDQKVRLGWTKFTGGIAQARHATMFATTLGASMSEDQSIYLAKPTTPEVSRTGVGTQDHGVNYQGLVTLPDIAPWGLGRTGHFAQEGYVLAEAAAGVTLQLTVTRDFGRGQCTHDVSLDPEGTETRVRRKFEDFHQGDIETVQFAIGDREAVNTSWNVDALILPTSASGRDRI